MNFIQKLKNRYAINQTEIGAQVRVSVVYSEISPSNVFTHVEYIGECTVNVDGTSRYLIDENGNKLYNVSDFKSKNQPLIPVESVIIERIKSKEEIKTISEKRAY